MNFVACWYNFYRWVGLILSVNEPQLEVYVKFMRPHSPSPSFYCSEQDDICTIPYYQNYLRNWHSFYFMSGRIYKLSRLSLKTIERNITNYV